VQGKPEKIANEAGGAVTAFGSYKLGVNDKGGDIDTLVVAPKDVKREDFFSSWYARLEEMAQGEDPLVEELHMVPGAFVPVIKCIYKKVELDLLFCSLAQDNVDPYTQDYSRVELIQSLDPYCVRSLNGTRVTDDLMRMVPNIVNFQQTLRAVKAWAKREYLASFVPPCSAPSLCSAGSKAFMAPQLKTSMAVCFVNAFDAKYYATSG
jgi:poly(A) polymerase